MHCGSLERSTSENHNFGTSNLTLVIVLTVNKATKALRPIPSLTTRKNAKPLVGKDLQGACSFRGTFWGTFSRVSLCLFG